MFIKRDPVNGFLWVEFREHPVVDFKNQQGTLFDVSAEGFAGFGSDFMIDGHFNQEQYCICLINKAFTFPSIQLFFFLKYQCSQILAPSQWLEDFSSLLKLNQNNPSIRTHQNKFELVTALVLEKWNQLKGTIGKRSNVFVSTISAQEKGFCIIKLKEEVKAKKGLDAKRFLLLRRRTDYLQEISANQESTFIKAIDMELNFLEQTKEFQEEEKETKKIVFKGSGRQLANVFSQLKELRDKDGDLIFEGNTKDYSRLIANNFSKVKGESLTESSIRRYLTDYKFDEQAKGSNQIDINLNLEKD